MEEGYDILSFQSRGITHNSANLYSATEAYFLNEPLLLEASEDYILWNTRIHKIFNE
jgi:hypothetical protein